MAEDFLIPTNKIGTTPFGGTNAPQVNLQPQQRPDFNIWSGLSQSLANFGGTALNIAQLEGEQDKVRQQYEAQLQEIINLKPRAKGETAIEQATIDKAWEDEAKSLLEQEQGRLQREGIIKAYENFTFIDEVEKSRAKQRLSFIENKMKEFLPALTNPTKSMSYEKAESTILADLQTQTLVDVAGNDITFDFQSLSTGELIAMTQGMAEIRMGMAKAIDDIKHERAIELSTELFKKDIFNLLEVFGNLSPELQVANIQKQFNKAFNTGVKLPNKEFFNSLTLWAEEKADSGTFSSETPQVVNHTLDSLVDSIESRPGHKLVPRGSENHARLEDARDKFNTKWAARQREINSQLEASQAGIQDTITSYVMDDVLAFTKDGKVLTPESKAEIYRTALSYAREENFYNPDKIIGQVDSIINSLEFEKEHPDKVAKYLHNISINKHSGTKLDQKLNDAKTDFDNGELNLSEYKLIRTQIESEKTAWESTNSAAAELIKAAEKEGGFGFTAMPGNIDSMMKSILAQNDVRENVGDRFNPEWVTLRADDNTPQPFYVQAVEEFTDTLRAAAITGTEYAPPSIKQFSDNQSKTLKDVLGYKESQIKNIIDGVNAPIVFEAPNDYASFRRNETKMKKAVTNMAAYQALLQALEWNKDTAKEEELKPSTLQGDFR